MHQDAMANRKMIQELQEQMEAKDDQIELLTDTIKVLAGIEGSVSTSTHTHAMSQLDKTRIIQYKLQQVEMIGLQL